MRLAHPVLDTQIVASTFFNAPTNSLFVKMVAASSKPNRLWSVKTVLTPKWWAWRIPSWANDDRLACPWIIWMRSRLMMDRKYGRNVKKLGRVAEEAMGMKGM